MPATHHLFAQWLPPLERSKLMGYSYAGHFKSSFYFFCIISCFYILHVVFLYVYPYFAFIRVQ